MTGMPAIVGVIGGVRMGAGVAQVFAAAGAEVSIVETGHVAAVRQRIAGGLAKAAERGELVDTAEEVLTRVSILDDIAGLPSSAELVVEAVPEQPVIKIDVLTRAEKVVSENAVLASDTGSLSIAELSAALLRSDRFLGVHFFNPVPASKLVEIVTTPDTAAGVVERVSAWVRGLGKTGVVVRDSPGFATSRLGVLLGLEGIRMLEEGVTDADAIDTAMELGYLHPIGPLRSTDLVGLDIRLAIAEYLHATLGERFAPPQLLREKVANGHLGRKTGQGFHIWN